MGYSIDSLKDIVLRTKELIKVFISSSMGEDENGHNWIEFRKNLADELDSSTILTPFRIEEHGSPIASEQFYLSKIEQADIVVAVVYEELRPGTENEIRYAVELQKPLLFIKIGDKETQSIKDIVSFLHFYDYCTTVRFDSLADLPSEILACIENTLVDLFRGRLFELSQRRASGIGVKSSEDASVPVEIIESFGLSQTRLLKRYGYDLDWLQPKTTDSNLEILGNAIIDWAIDGKPLITDQFKNYMFSAMKDSGCNEPVLEHRYNAMDLYLRGDFEGALSEIEIARLHVPNKDSWIYGNILIDKRNISMIAKDNGPSIHLATQEEIEASNKPVMFPLALKYECNAIGELERSQSNKRTSGPSTVSVDNRIAIALKDVALHVFISVLYGSIASVMYSRKLLAKILLGYSDVFENPTLAYEGLRIALLSGEGSFFSKEFDSRFDFISNIISSEADELWRLSGKVPLDVMPSTRCVLIEKCGSYFTEEVFEEIVGYLTEDKHTFFRCWEKWVKAINFIKLRLKPNDLTKLLTEILSENLFVSAKTVGSIIMGYPIKEADKQNQQDLAVALRNNQEELIKGGMSLSTFAVVEDAIGETILCLDGVEYAEIDVAAYNATLQPDDKSTFLKKCFMELEHQVKQNNSSGMYSLFCNDVVTPICDLIQEEGAECLDEEDTQVLERILEESTNYQGALSVVDGVLQVCFAIKCNQNESTTQFIDRFIKTLSLDGVQRNSFPLDNFCLDVLECHLMAIDVIMEASNTAKYLSKGIQFQHLSYKAKIAYASTFAQLIKTKRIGDEQREFACALALAMSKEEESVIRKYALECIVECSARWGSEYFRDALFGFLRDPSDDVRYALLKVCMESRLENQELTDELYEVLSNDVNWFIRWHAANDEGCATA